MAQYSTGIAVNFNGVAALEPTNVSWQFCGSMPIGRDNSWTPDCGGCTVEMIGSNASTALYGVRGPLLVTGGGADLSVMAVCIGVSVATEVNGITRYTVAFQFVESVEYPF